ncbi:MAG: Hcp family type VI secretion system effector [Microbacterium sp.]
MSYFLQLDGIDGESTVRGHEKWLEVAEISWGAAQAVSAAGGGRTGRTTLRPLLLSTRLTIATPVLLDACARGRTINDATFEAVTDGQSSSVTLRIQLEEILLTTLDLVGEDGEARPRVSFSLTYGQITITTFVVGEFGGQREAASATWERTAR